MSAAASLLAAISPPGERPHTLGKVWSYDWATGPEEGDDRVFWEGTVAIWLPAKRLGQRLGFGCAMGNNVAGH